MAEAVYRDPTFDAAVQMEVREKKGCGVCVRGKRVIGAYLCTVNKEYPRCRREKKGFKYDTGE
jgi:hypothetical protein